jgi:uncharacterized protein YfeS
MRSNIIQLSLGLKRKCSFPHFRENFRENFCTKIDSNSKNIDDMDYLGNGAYD